jgi:membrane protein YdbS with pleckstrin-like domain
MKKDQKRNITISSRSFPLRKRSIIKKSLVSIFAYLLLVLFLFNLYEGFTEDFLVYSVAGLSIILILLLGHYFSLRVFFYEIEDEYIIIKRHAIFPQEITIEYSRLKDIVIFRDLFDRLFGLYQIRFIMTISSPFAAKIAHIEGLDDVEAHELKVVLDRLTEKSRKNVR